MEYVTLGKTGLQVSRVGFGGIPIQRTKPEDCTALLDAALEAGINYIDTARAYSVSEQYIGMAIEGKRDRFCIASKSMALTKDDMAHDIEISLSNLRTDYLDCYQLHNPDMGKLERILALGGAFEALLEAKKEGKIRHIGLTTHFENVLERAMNFPWVETLMFPYNLVETHGTELIEKCKSRNIGFICMKPFAGGAIEDTDLAMRFICANPNVTVVIPGMYCPDEVYANVVASENSEPLTAQEQQRIEQIRKELGISFCRRCGYCAPCTVGINIPGVFVSVGYLERYHLSEFGKERYFSLPVRASSCVECGICETRCPYQLPIRKMLKKCVEKFGE